MHFFSFFFLLPIFGSGCTPSWTLEIHFGERGEGCVCNAIVRPVCAPRWAGVSDQHVLLSM